MVGCNSLHSNSRTMLQTTIVIGVLAVILLLVGYFKGKGQHIAGLKQSLDMTVEILPMLALSFIVAGMAQVLIPRDIMAKWVGPESGFKGIMMGSLAGAISPGGPYVNFPIVAGFLKAGAGVATMVAFMDRLLERSELQPTILSSKSLRSNC